MILTYKTLYIRHMAIFLKGTMRVRASQEATAKIYLLIVDPMLSGVRVCY